MPEGKKPSVAVVDYGLGNLFSVKHACEKVGLSAFLTSSAKEIDLADCVILPGVGAFGDAMRNITELGLKNVLRDAAHSGKPLIGICLGMQLLMSESSEFGSHEGLNIIRGDVVRFEDLKDQKETLKVPQVGWNQVRLRESACKDPFFRGIKSGEYMYFVHSYYVKPYSESVSLAMTRYGDVEFCSSLRQENVFACQFHPERSGVEGLKIYSNIAYSVRAYAIRNNEKEKLCQKC
ncbi:imidazole glycerol phosphate synthase subunit HisH [Elusimicrobiota bacterium]